MWTFGYFFLAPKITDELLSSRRLYEQLAERIRQRILNGTLNPGEDLPDEHIFARKTTGSAAGSSVKRRRRNIPDYVACQSTSPSPPNSGATCHGDEKL